MEYKTCEEYVLDKMLTAEKENETLKNENAAYKLIIKDYNRIFELLKLRRQSYCVDMEAKIANWNPELFELLDAYGIGDKINKEGEPNE